MSSFCFMVSTTSNDFCKPTLALKLHQKSTCKKPKPSRSSCWSTAIFLLFRPSTGSTISRQILFGEFEFSPTPETVSVAFGIKEDDPVKEWGSTNAENKANYGGASAWNLKKPAMQQDDETEKLVGWLGPGASHRFGANLHRWGQSCMEGGNSSLILVGENFMMMFFFKSFTVYTWKFLDFKSD